MPTRFVARTSAASDRDVRDAVAAAVGVSPDNVHVASFNATTGDVEFEFRGDNATGHARALAAMPETERQQRAGLSGLAAASQQPTPAPPPADDGVLATILGSSLGVPIGVGIIVVVVGLVVGRVLYTRRRDAALRAAQDGMERDDDDGVFDNDAYLPPVDAAASPTSRAAAAQVANNGELFFSPAATAVGTAGVAARQRSVLDGIDDLDDGGADPLADLGLDMDAAEFALAAASSVAVAPALPMQGDKASDLDFTSDDDVDSLVADL